MINGTITLSKTGTSSSGTMYGQILWSAESNGSAKNNSTVKATVQVKRQAGFTTTGTWKGSLTVGGTTKEISWYGSISSSWVTVATITVDVAHANDGSGSCYIYAKVSGPSGTSQSGVYVSGSETIALEKIARFAVAVAFADFNDEANPVVQYSNPAGTEIESLEAALSTDGSTAAIGYRSIEKNGTQYTFALTAAERNTLLSAAANSNTLAVYVHIRSSIAGTAQVSTLKAVMSVVNAAPVLAPVIVDTNSATIALTGNSAILVALHSVASVKANATAKKQATIKSVSITNGLVTLTADGTLTPVVGFPITITATDSRGNKTTYKAPNRVIPYIDPISTIENSMPNALGELDLNAKGMVFDGSFGAKANAFSVKYRFKEGYGSYGSWISFDSATMDGNAFVAEASVTGLDYQKAYTFQVAVYDSIHPNGVLSVERKFVSVPVFDWSDIDFKFNVPVSMSGKKLTDIPTPESDGDAVPLMFANKNFAPAGHGLGGMGKESNSFNKTIASGFYSMSGSYCADNPEPKTDFNYGNLFVINRYDALITQFLSYQGIHAVRHSTDGGSTWSPVDYINPPMLPGVEYRTTERWNNKAVYTKAVDCGALPNSTYKEIAIETTLTRCIRYNLVNKYSSLMLTGNKNIQVEFAETFVQISTTADLSVHQAFCVLWYTKD